MNLFLTLTAFLILSLSSRSVLAINNTAQDIEEQLKELVNEQRGSSGLVGLGAVIIQNGQVIGPAVSGERKKGSKVLLSDNDKWHVGSVTKSFTATLIARLVEKGELSWNTTVKEVFSEGDGLNPGWNRVTLEHLLTHTSGSPSIPLSAFFKKPAEGSERMMAREKTVIKILKKKPRTAPGDSVKYSNAGYVIAGVMAEKKTGMPWEELIKQEIFAPLQLQSAGFGSPQDGDEKLSQPRGHMSLLGMTVTRPSDNTPIIGPAGTIHMSLKDLALYANEHLQGEQGKGSLLKTETFQRLHRPFKDNVAYGWGVSLKPKWGVDTVYMHTGSNGRWYTVLVILPDINAAIAVVTNEGDFRLKTIERSASEIIKQLVPPLTESYNHSIQSAAKASAD